MNCEKSGVEFALLRAVAAHDVVTASLDRRRSKSDRPSVGNQSVQGKRRQHDRIDGLARGRPGALKIDAADIVAGEIARQAAPIKRAAIPAGDRQKLRRRPGVRAPRALAKNPP